MVEIWAPEAPGAANGAGVVPTAEGAVLVGAGAGVAEVVVAGPKENPPVVGAEVVAGCEAGAVVAGVKENGAAEGAEVAAGCDAAFAAGLVKENGLEDEAGAAAAVVVVIPGAVEGVDEVEAPPRLKPVKGVF